MLFFSLTCNVTVLSLYNYVDCDFPLYILQFLDIIVQASRKMQEHKSTIMSFNDARKECVKADGDLVTMETPLDFINIASVHSGAA